MWGNSPTSTVGPHQAPPGTAGKYYSQIRLEASGEKAGKRGKRIGSYGDIPMYATIRPSVPDDARWL